MITVHRLTCAQGTNREEEMLETLSGMIANAKKQHN
jgi:hypothetical protein